MLIRLLGDAHRDHLGLVREELEEIRRLSRAMDGLRARLDRADAVGRLGAPAPGPEPSAPPGPWQGAENGEQPPVRPDPHLVHALLGERIAAWERERQSRWRKVLELLVRP
jgi:hypothetical protein